MNMIGTSKTLEKNPAKKKSTKNKKQANQYVRYEYETNIKIGVTLPVKDIGKLKTIAFNNPNCYLTLEDYLISVITNEYEYIEANKLFKIKNISEPYDKKRHNLKVNKLSNPKLQRYKNNVKDTVQLTLDNYY